MTIENSSLYKKITGITNPIGTYTAAEDALRKFGIVHIDVGGNINRWKELAGELTNRVSKKVHYVGPSDVHKNNSVHLYTTIPESGQNQDYKVLLDKSY